MVRQKLLEHYRAVRQQTLRLCQPLATEDYIPQPVVDVSPPRWHLAHTTWFFETFILSQHLPGYRLFHETYPFLFNSYYNTFGDKWERALRGALSRPTVQEVMDFRAAIDGAMLEFLQDCDDQAYGQIQPLVELGLQHEQQHQELLVTDLKWILLQNPLRPIYQEGELPQPLEPAQPKWLSIDDGLYEIGFQGEGFAFDNERERHKVYLRPFRIRNTTITNGEYLEFMQDGGYEEFRHWLGEGWELVQQQGWNSPMYWVQEDEQWHEATLRGVRPLDLNAPVTHISFYEAEAFASWAGKRLLTEAEWEVAHQQHGTTAEAGNFVDDSAFHPVVPKAGEGLRQMLGNCWEWTQSAYLPYPGYRQEEGALGEYNGKFMVNQMVLRGGSCATPRSHIRPTYRNFFHPDKRWQFSGIRLAEDR